MASKSITKDVPVYKSKSRLGSIFSTKPAAVAHARAGRSGGSGGGGSQIKHIILSQKTVKYQRRDGSKAEFTLRENRTLVIGCVPRGAQDLFTTGAPGEHYIFPTASDDPAATDGPDGAGNDSSGVAFTSFKDTLRPIKISTTKFSLPTNKKDSEDPTPVMLTGPGSVVTTWGNSAKSGTDTKNVGRAPTFFNARGLQIDQPPPAKGEELTRFKELFLGEEVALHGAFAASHPARGFFSVGELEPDAAEQAAKCQEHWHGHYNKSIDALEAIGKGRGGLWEQRCTGQAAMLRDQSSADAVAAGDTSMFDLGDYDFTVAPLVVDGFRPWCKVHSLVRRLEEGDASLPSAFCAAQVVHYECHNNQLTVDLHPICIFDRDRAIEHLRERPDEANPFVTTPTASISFAYSMREMARFVGTQIPSKVKMMMAELLPYMDFAGVFRVFPLEAGMPGMPPSVKTSYADLFYADPQASIRGIGVPVSVEFLEKTLCLQNKGAGCTFTLPAQVLDVDDSPKPVDDGGNLYSLPDPESKGKTVGTPTLQNDGYQELTTSKWFFCEFDALGGDFSYYVVFPGLSAKLEGGPCTTTKAGEALVRATAGGDDANVGKYLKDECAVYVFRNA